MFEGYQNLKLKRGERDLADRYAMPRTSYSSCLHLPNSRTHMLLSGLKENGLKGELVDFV